MDDFGTGYSSLAYLQRLPIDVLKVDCSFVNGMLEEEDSFEIVNAIISLARSLMMDTVAEGIERPEQAARLRSMGCCSGQGSLYARSTEGRPVRKKCVSGCRSRLSPDN